MSSSTEFAPLRLGDAPMLGDEHAAARAAGYAEGWAAGRREAQAREAAEKEQRAAVAQRAASAQQNQVERSVRSLAQAVTTLQSQSVDALSELTDLVLESAITLARSLVRTELTVAVDPGLAALRRALAPLPVEGRVVVRLHPEDLTTLDDHLALGPGRSTLLDGYQVEIVADPSLNRGDSVAEQGVTRVDARIDAALARVQAALQTAQVNP